VNISAFLPRPVTGMKRRAFILLTAGATIASTVAAWAQAIERVRQIGVLLPFDDENDGPVHQLWPAFQQRLRERGWTEGRNIKFDVHFTSQNIDRIRTGATELVARRPDLIVVWSNPALAAIKQATQTIPVIFALVGDPVGSGLVESLARPGANLTGFQNFEPAVAGKWLELLKEIAPGLHRVAILYNQNIPANADFVHTAQTMSDSLGVMIAPTELHDAADLKPMIADFALEPNSGLMVTPNPLNSRINEAIIGLCRSFYLPAIYPFHIDAEKGGLVSYGFDTVEQQRGVADYVDRVLRGDKPGDLPVQTPTKYQLVINLRTAKELRLNVPINLQQIADEIIE
jgi:putative tryptophan/tyrosine transport system substrate-binding protein